MANKRKKPTLRTQNGKSTVTQDQTCGPTIRDLPLHILLAIVLKLSLKGIVFCKSVCKSWYNLISNPEFVKLHLAQGKPCALARLTLPRISRTLYFLEPEEGCSPNFGQHGQSKYARKDQKSCELNGKVTIPLRNTRVLLDDLADIRPIRRHKNLMKLEPTEHVYIVANSCNGLFCLVGASSSHREPFVVCNPITGEFIHLPKCCVEYRSYTIQNYGLGFSTKSNQYKAISIFDQWNKNSNDAVSLTLGGTTAKIHTLGTDSWRSLTISPDNHKLKFKDSPTYINGAIHWLLEDMIVNKDSNGMASFDMEDECFHFHSFPLPYSQKGKGHYMNMGVLGGCLCVYINAFTYDHIDIWVMRDNMKNGVCKSWTQLFSIHLGVDRGIGRYRPISYSNNGELLMFNSFENELIYYDRVRGINSKYLKAYSFEPNFEVITCTPSFISLKDLVTGSDVTVLNVNSRYI